MRKYIKNKVYDTDTAKLMGTWSEQHLPEDHPFWEKADLYQKKTGEFFLYVDGGPECVFGMDVGSDKRLDLPRILTISYESAMTWARTHLDPDLYEEIFGVTVSMRLVHVSCYLSAATVSRIKRGSQKAGLQQSEYIEVLLRKALGEL